MKLALYAYNQAQGKASPTQTAPTTGTPIGGTDEAKLGDLGEYIKETMYGGEHNFRTDFSAMKTDEERKAKVMEGAKAMINKYKADAQANANVNFSDLQNISDVENAVTSNDWEKFKTASYKLKWQPSEFLLTDEQKAQLEAAKQSEAVAGQTPEIQQQLLGSGYTKVDTNWAPEGVDQAWFRKVLSENSARVLLNPTTGKHTIINPSGAFNYKQDNPFEEGYGYGWTTDLTGAHVYTPKTNTGIFGEDEYAGQNIGRELKIEGLGDVTSAIGWSGQVGGNYAKDVLGRRDFTKELVVTTSDGKRIKLLKQDDGTYKDERGIAQKPIIKGYGQGVHEIYKYKDVLPDIPEIQGPGEGYNYVTAYDTIRKALANKEVSPNLTREASKLLWSLGNDESIRSNQTIKGNIQDLLAKYQENLVAYKKDGGVLKFASGDTFRRLRQQTDRKLAQQAKVDEPKTTAQRLSRVRNIEGT